MWYLPIALTNGIIHAVLYLQCCYDLLQCTVVTEFFSYLKMLPSQKASFVPFGPLRKRNSNEKELCDEMGGLV